MEEEDQTAQLEEDIEELRRQLQLAQHESFNRKNELKRDRAFLGNELQRVREKAAVTEHEKEAYEIKLKRLRNQVKELQEAAKLRNEQLGPDSADRVPDDDSARREAEVAALQSQVEALRRVWVIQDEQWSKGTLVDVTSPDSAIITTADGLKADHALADLAPRDLRPDDECVANLADLGPDGLQDPVLVETLLDNKNKGACFTFVGSVLLYLTDLEPNIDKGPEDRLAYRCCKHTRELRPHVFSVLETAYRSMRLEQLSQSVILTGTAGAGKSELFRSAVEYLVLDRHVGNVHRIMDGLTVLEAFGCAQTVTSKFSPRMSTLVEVQYDIAGTALGASVAVYGFEKMRITEQEDFNFAVFYQMCAGATEGEKQTMHLMSASEFPYLNSYLNSEENRRITNSAGVNYDSAGDVERYRQLKNAMNNIGLDAVMRAAVFRVLAAILWLGKIDFLEENMRQQTPIIVDRSVLDKAAHLLRCTSTELEAALTSDTQHSFGEVDGLSDIEIQNQNAAYARDMLAQALYTRVFNWIIERINALLSNDDAFSVVGVLDLVSFEMLDEDNSFDHFYRNYATECVENLFNRDFFEIEQEEYEAEKLKLPDSFVFPTNRGCIDLIDRQGGFISLLDQECQFVNGSEPALIRRLKTAFDRDPHYSQGRAKRGFNIKHWQSEVHYSTADLIEKNQDVMPPNVVSLMDECKCRFLAELFPSADIPESSRPVTLLTQLKNQMAALLRPMSSPVNGSTPYFVRCLSTTRPGDSENNQLDSGYLLKQLKAYRIPQMLQLRHLGFPVRSSFVDFYHRYRIFSETQLVDRADSMYKQQCEFILAAMNFNRGTFQTGLTKVYLKEAQLKLLEKKRHDLRERAALRVQKQFRTARFLARFREWRKNSGLLKPIIRGVLARQQFKQLEEARRMAEAEEHSTAFNKYVREQLDMAKREAERMHAAFLESEAWNIEWRREMLEKAQELAKTMFEKVSQSNAHMDALGIRDWRAPEEIDESMLMIPPKEVAACVHEVVTLGNEEALKEYRRREQEKEDEKKVKQALWAEEQYLRSVAQALSRRYDPHPLEELAWMRAEEQYQRVADAVRAATNFDVESLKAPSSLETQDGDPVVDQNPLLAAMLTLQNGLVQDETERIAAGDLVKFDAPPPRPAGVFEIVQVPQIEEDEEEYVYETIPEVKQVEVGVEVSVPPRAELPAAQVEMQKADIHIPVEPEPAAEAKPEAPIPPPPDFVPPLELGTQAATRNTEVAIPFDASKDDEARAIDQIIDRKRQQRENADVDIDSLFADIDNELASIKHMYFEPAESQSTYEYVGKEEEEPELDYKYRFKYKFRGVDAGLTDKDLQSLV